MPARDRDVGRLAPLCVMVQGWLTWVDRLGRVRLPLDPRQGRGDQPAGVGRCQQGVLVDGDRKAVAAEEGDRLGRRQGLELNLGYRRCKLGRSLCLVWIVQNRYQWYRTGCAWPV